MPPRGYGTGSLPATGKQSLPGATFRTLDDIAADPDHRFAPGRVFLGRIDASMVGFEDNRHVVTIGGSRSGKSACVLVPNLMLYPGSALVLDPKGELAASTAHHRASALGQNVVILDPFEVVKNHSTASTYRRRHDPLEEIDILLPDGTPADLIDDAALLAEALVIETGGDQHWTLAARNLITTLILMTRLNHIPLSWIHEALSGDTAPLWHMMSEYGLGLTDAPDVVADACAMIRAQGDSFRHKSDREAPAIVSSAIEQLGFLRSPKMRAFLDAHEVELRSLIAGKDDTPTTIYLVLPAGRMGTHNRWLRAMVTLALNHFERSPHPPALPILMMMEEFAALEHLRPIERAAGFIAGAGVRLWIVLQDLTQLKRHYKDGWETFIGNAGLIQAFSVSDLTTCKYLSERLGKTTVEVENRKVQTADDRNRGVPAAHREFRDAPLLTPAEVALVFARKSQRGTAAGGLSLILTPDGQPFVVDRVHWSELEGR